MIPLDGTHAVYFCGRTPNAITGSLDDFLHFFSANLGHVHESSQEGFRAHGRGAIVFREHEAGEMFMEAYYCLPAGDESPELTEDIKEYDPETELLVGYETSGHPGGLQGLWIGRVEVAAEVPEW